MELLVWSSYYKWITKSYACEQWLTKKNCAIVISKIILQDTIKIEKEICCFLNFVYYCFLFNRLINYPPPSLQQIFLCHTLMQHGEVQVLRTSVWVIKQHLDSRLFLPPENITVNPAIKRLISLSDFQAGTGTTTHATFNTEQHFSLTRATLVGTIVWLQVSDCGEIAAAEVLELLRFMTFWTVLVSKWVGNMDCILAYLFNSACRQHCEVRASHLSLLYSIKESCHKGLPLWLYQLVSDIDLRTVLTWISTVFNLYEGDQGQAKSWGWM